MDVKVLRKIGKGVPVEKALSLGINYRELISSGLARKVVRKESKLFIPAGAPRWASKFKFSRKKHGIEESITEHSMIVLTEKGIRLSRKKRINSDEEDDTKSKEETMVVDVDAHNDKPAED